MLLRMTWLFCFCWRSDSIWSISLFSNNMQQKRFCWFFFLFEPLPSTFDSYSICHLFKPKFQFSQIVDSFYYYIILQVSFKNFKFLFNFLSSYSSFTWTCLTDRFLLFWFHVLKTLWCFRNMSFYICFKL